MRSSTRPDSNWWPNYTTSFSLFEASFSGERKRNTNLLVKLLLKISKMM